MSATTWLRFSLFSDRSTWPLLLNKVLQPLLMELLREEILCFRFFLSSAGGQNIRVALLIDVKKAKVTALKIDDHFKCFYKKDQCLASTSALTINSIFLNFPVNSIRYGLFTLRNKDFSKLEIEFHNQFNLFIINILSMVVYNDEELFSLSFKLHRILFDCIDPSYFTGRREAISLLCGPDDWTRMTDDLDKDITDAVQEFFNVAGLKTLFDAFLNKNIADTKESYLQKIKKTRIYINECLEVLPNYQLLINYHLTRPVKD